MLDIELGKSVIISHSSDFMLTVFYSLIPSYDSHSLSHGGPHDDLRWAYAARVIVQFESNVERLAAR